MMNFAEFARQNAVKTNFTARVKGTGEKVKVKDIASLMAEDILDAEKFTVSGVAQCDIASLEGQKRNDTIDGITAAVGVLAGEPHATLLAILTDPTRKHHARLLSAVHGKWGVILPEVREVLVKAGFGPAVSPVPPADSSAPPAVSSAPPAVSSAPPAVSSAPPDDSSAPPVDSSAPPAVNGRKAKVK